MTPGFARNIRPLFREEDRADMRPFFDLWSHDDVREHADAILERLEDRTMPCDGPWDEQRLERFRAWVGAGCPA